MRPGHGPQQAVLENRVPLKSWSRRTSADKAQKKGAAHVSVSCNVDNTLLQATYEILFDDSLPYFFKIIVTGDRSSTYNTTILATVLSSYCLNFLVTF